MAEALQIVRLAAVLVLLVAAALVATPKGRVPLALRGIMRTMRRDGAIPGGAHCEGRVAASRKVLAFLLLAIAAGVAAI